MHWHSRAQAQAQTQGQRQGQRRIQRSRVAAVLPCPRPALWKRRQWQYWKPVQQWRRSGVPQPRVWIAAAAAAARPVQFYF